MNSRLLLLVMTVVGCTSPKPKPDVDLALLPDGGRLRWVEQLTRAQAGEAVDLDGDGVPDVVTVTLADGSTVQRGQNPDGFRFERVQHPDGTSVTRDFRPDAGHPFRIEELTVAGNVTTHDENDDGWPETRERLLLPSDGGRTLTVVEEVDGGGRWVETRRGPRPEH